MDSIDRFENQSEIKSVKKEKLFIAYSISAFSTTIPIIAGYGILKSGSIEYTGTASLLILGGILVGPSCGQFYLGSNLHGWLSLSTRTFGMLFFTAGLIANSTHTCLEGEFQCDNGNDNVNGATLFGLLIYSGGLLYSFLEIPHAVSKTYSRIPASSFSLAPTISPTRNGQLQYGIASALHF